MRAPRWRGVPSSLYGPARRRVTPGAAGRSASNHIALTFDDGPDPRSTPSFIDLLAHHRTSATFFLIGERAARHPDVVAALVEAGHEVAVHGWTHRCAALTRPDVLEAEVIRTRELLDSLGGRSQHEDGESTVRWYRPPYGIATLSSSAAAQRAGLTSLLWTAWGRDWTRAATPSTIVRTVQRTLRPGGTVLLHDTDAYSAAGSWRHTLAATDQLLDAWHARDLGVGPAREHRLPVPPRGDQVPARFHASSLVPGSEARSASPHAPRRADHT